MRRAAAPWWLAEPSRFAGLTRAAALAALLALAIALPVAAAVSGSAERPAGDPTLYYGAVEAMRHGGDYYPAVAATLESGERAAGLLAFPPPALATIAAGLPGWGLAAMLFALAGAAFLVWRAAFVAALSRPGAPAGASLLLLAGLAPSLMPSMLYTPEVWSGLFVALSLGFWTRGGRVEAAAFGLAAALVREAAGAYLLVMAVFALRGGARREALGWAAALAVLAAALAAHWRAARDALGSPGPTPEDAGVAGPGWFLSAVVEASPLAPLPMELAGPLLALALFGWSAWRSGVGPRLLATLAALAGLAWLRPEGAADWGHLVAPPLLAGLVFAPDGLRDLVSAVMGARRRITVTRVVR